MMKIIFHSVFLFLFLVNSAYASNVSTIDPTVPASDSDLDSSVIRQNFQNAYNDITNIWADLAGVNFVYFNSTSHIGDYVIVSADAGSSSAPPNFIQMNCSSSCTLTVPPNSSAPIPVGAKISISQVGIGQLSVAEGPGVTINSSTTLRLFGQYSVAELRQVSANTWILSGDLQ